MQAGRMAVARQGACLANGAAEEMKMETQDVLMRGADGDEGDVRQCGTRCATARLWACAPLCLCAQWCTVHLRAPNLRNATEMAGGAPPGKQHKTIRKHQQRRAKVTLQTHQITEDRGPRTEDRGPSSGSGGATHAGFEPATSRSEVQRFARSAVISLGDNYPIFFLSFMTIALADVCGCCVGSAERVAACRLPATPLL